MRLPARSHSRYVPLVAAVFAAFSFLLVLPEALAVGELGPWHKDPSEGYAVRIPKGWTRVPPGTGESVEVGKWYGRTISRGFDSIDIQPQMVVVRFPVEKSNPTTTPGDSPGGEEAGSSLPQGATFGEPTSVKDYLNQLIEGYKEQKCKVKPQGTKKIEIDGHKGELYLDVCKSGGTSFEIMAASAENGVYEYGLVYVINKREYDGGYDRIFLYSIRSFKFLHMNEAGGPAVKPTFVLSKESRPPAEEKRWLEAVEKKISDVKEWAYGTTKNYLVLYDRAVPLEKVVALAKRIEAIRKEVYEKIFPPDKPITAISVMRVCKNRQQYLAYGAPAMSAGYWSAHDKELVFYFGGPDAVRVLQHEAFHQYIYYAFGAFDPATWFNEGHGDYFSGWNFKNGHFEQGEFQWRTGVIKNAIATKSFVPLKKFLHYSQEQYYANANLCYAEGWSFIYFLRNTRNERYRKILPTYFDVLKNEFAKQKKDPNMPDGVYDPEVSKKILADAFKAAFKGIDIAKLQADWSKFRF